MTFALSAVALVVAGHWLDRRGEPNSLYFIPMKYWSIALIIFSIAQFGRSHDPKPTNAVARPAVKSPAPASAPPR